MTLFQREVKMKGLILLLSFLVFLFTANTASAVVITNAFMTDVEPSNCDASLLPIVTTFYENDKLACFFVSFNYAQVGDTYQTKWYYNGRLYINGDTTLVTSLSSIKCMSRIMKIFGAEPMELPGNWNVRFYYNNEVLLEWSFEIKERCAAGAALSDDSESLNTLRIFRDQALNKTLYGRKMVELFYKHSPALVKAMDDSPALKAGIRALLKTCVLAINRFN
jgi:hypothetical protein